MIGDSDPFLSFFIIINSVATCLVVKYKAILKQYSYYFLWCKSRYLRHISRLVRLQMYLSRPGIFRHVFSYF